MKNFLRNYLGLPGLAIYFVLAIAIRIPAALVFMVIANAYLLIINPLRGDDDCPKWLNDLYDWYCGK